MTSTTTTRRPASGAFLGARRGERQVPGATRRPKRQALLSPAALADHGPRAPTGSATVHGRPGEVCNPYPWFGAPRAWPRGLPLERINAGGCAVEPTHHGHRLGVVQSLANRDPDVDAFYRLGPRAALPLPFSFAAPDGKLLVLAQSAVAPFNAQATWWRAPAFAGLMLPTTVHGRVSDIWRSYVAQRAMRCAGLRLAFAAPAVEQLRNDHDYLADYMSERPLYERAGALVRALAEVPCAGSMASTVAAAYVALYERGFVERDDVERGRAFLRDLGRALAPAAAEERRAPAAAGVRVLGQFNYPYPKVARWIKEWHHVDASARPRPAAPTASAQVVSRRAVSVYMPGDQGGPSDKALGDLNAARLVRYPGDAGFVSPMKNLIREVAYARAGGWRGVLYVHDDMVLSSRLLSDILRDADSPRTA